MATVKKGILTRAGEWWVHLRPYGKREFWHRERKAAERDVAERVSEVDLLNSIEREIDGLLARKDNPESGRIIDDDYDRKMWGMD